MSDKNDDFPELEDDFDAGLEDDFYQDALEDEFESDFDDNFDSDYEADIHDDFADEGDIDPALMSKEKKGGLNLSFNTIVILGAVVVGFIVLLVQVTKAPSTSPGAERFTSALQHQGADDGVLGQDDPEVSRNTSSQVSNQEDLASTEIKTQTNKPVSQEEAFLFEPDVLDTMGEELNAIPQPAPIVAIEEEVISTETVLENIEDVVADIVESTEAEQVQADMEVQEPRSPEVKTTPVIEEAVVDIKAENDIETAAASQDGEVSEVTEAIEQPMSTLVNVDLSTIEQKLDLISSRLDDVDVQMSQMQGDVGDKIESIQTTVARLEKRVQTNASKVERAAKVTPKRQAAPKPASRQEPPRQQAPKTPSWELKAAQPGKAWISEKGSTSIKSVEVGDRINGLGQIRNITFQNGRWQVVGSAKTLVQ